MILYSQKDPEYKNVTLPKSNLKMETHGCFVSSLAMLSQKHPSELLRDEFFVDGGYIISSEAAKSVGLRFRASTSIPPKTGWHIGVTNQYAPKYPTHFLLVNPEKQLQIDPLKENPEIEKLSYKIIQYRVFSGSPLNNNQPTVPDWAADSCRKAYRKGIKTDPTIQLGDNFYVYHLYVMLDKYNS